MKTCVTVDLDNYQDYQSLIDTRFESAPPSFYGEAVPRFLDLFDRCGVRATFFMVGRDGAVAAHRKLVQEIAARGHELGNHSFSHPYNFSQLSRTEKEREIEQADAAIADIIGERPVGFRAPSYDVDLETLEVLSERGYLYDASVVPSPLMWALMLYGKLFVRYSDYRLGRPASAFAPSHPYRPSSGALHRECTSGKGPQILEIPCSVAPILRIPFYSTLLRRLGRRTFSLLVRAYGGRPSVLHSMFHLIELADLGESSLARAFERMPALSLSLAAREDFLSHAVQTLGSLGEAIPLCEFGRSTLEAPGREPAG